MEMDKNKVLANERRCIVRVLGKVAKMATSCQRAQETMKMNTDDSHGEECDLGQYFGKQELKAMSSQQQTKLKNLALNYEAMLYMDLPAIRPNFMSKNISDLDSHQTRAEHLEDNDVICNLDLEGKESDKSISPSVKKHIYEGVDPNERTVKKKTDGEIVRKLVNKIKERKSETIMRLVEPCDVQFLYCDECNKEYDTDCPVHGSLDLIKDTEIIAEYDLDKALNTIPPGLVVRKSSIEGAGFGVFTEKGIPPRVMFGPYDGKKIFDEMMASNSGYSWQIYADGKPSHFVDGRDKAISNWMRYVNCAPTESEQNLTAFQFKGGIYYRSYKTIHPGTELLCWYGNEYGRELGILRDKNMMIWPKLVNAQECYPCVFCETAFTAPVYNVRHLVRVHGGDKLTRNDMHVLGEWLVENDFQEGTRITEKKKPNNNTFLKRYIMTRHKMSKTFKCRLCEYSTFSRFQLKTHRRIHQEKKLFNCNLCDYVCSQKQSLKTHMKKHTGEKNFQCHVCGHMCSLNSNLVYHMTKHMEDRHYICDICGFACKSDRDLSQHKRKHKREKIYKCDSCDYETYVKSYLCQHMKKHLFNESYKCDTCDYATHVKSYLPKHMRTHFGNKPHKCDLCDYASHRRHNLTVHKRIHSRQCFKCGVCDFSTSSSASLIVHRKQHTGQKPFKCGTCDYECYLYKHLKTHRRKHTEEKHYLCDLCGFKCDYRHSLKRHLRRHTRGVKKVHKCDICSYTCKKASSLQLHMRKHTGKKTS